MSRPASILAKLSIDVRHLLSSLLRLPQRINMSLSKPKRILIVGASYAGLAAAINLLDLSEGRPQRFSPSDPAPSAKFPVEIIVVDERDGYYHVIGSPLALASSSFAERSWTRFEDVPGLRHPSVKFVHGSVIKVHTETKTAKISPHGSEGKEEAIFEQQYDYLLAASGLRRVAPVVPASFTRDDYLLETGRHIDRVKDAVNKQGIVVIGGGAVGIEMAAELKLVHPELKVRLIHSRDRLLSSEPLPDDFKDETLRLLRSVGVEVLTGKRVSRISEPDAADGRITVILSDGENVSTSFVIHAISRAMPTSGYLPDTVLDEEGHVKVQSTLHFLPSDFINNASVPTSEIKQKSEQAYDPHHLAAGDIALWTGIRRCGAAMHMGSFAAHNIHAHILSTIATSTSEPSSSPTYKSLSEHPPMIGLALGNTGIAYSPTEGIKSGVDILKSMFQDDIGFSICWNYMRLGEAPPVAEAVHAGPADVVEAPSANKEVENISKSTEEMSLDEWIAEAKSSHSRTSSSSNTGPKTTTAVTPDHNSTSSPSLSASSTDSISEPRTPFDAVGNAEVTDFEILEDPGLDASVEADVAVEAVRYDVEAPSTKVSPIRVVEGNRVVRK